MIEIKEKEIKTSFKSDSEVKYARYKEILKLQWCLSCDHDEKLAFKIERAEAALTMLENLGFNLISGEVENE